MGMCAIRGPVVATSGPAEDVDAGDATPRSTTSSSSDVSSSSQELEAEEVGDLDHDGAALWQRTIPRGRRCRPLSFSGLIVYDASGNQLAHCPRLPRDGRGEDRVVELD